VMPLNESTATQRSGERGAFVIFFSSSKRGGKEGMLVVRTIVPV
jgi:hypothetical protein